MMGKIRSLIKSYLQHLDIAVVSYRKLVNLKQHRQSHHDIEMLLLLSNESTEPLLKYLRKSKSQLRQDLFVLSQLNFKTNGFFVEFGATNGVDISNTHLMEKEFGWTGILAEPAKFWHKDLRNNRSASIETDCVWKDSHSILRFNETDDIELSTIAYFNDFDLHKESRKSGKEYDVKTISLNDLLIKYNAPEKIDYLSIDTEGSEFEILSNFDFSKHSFQVITCEHNFTPMREKIFDLLSRNGYTRHHQELSKCDDWYVKSR